MRRLMVFFQVVLGLGFVIMTLASGVVYLHHDGLSTDLYRVLGVLALIYALLMVTGRYMTGRWFAWSRR